MIDPNLITTVRVGELPTADFENDSKIPHEIGTDLKSGTVAQLVTFLNSQITYFPYELKFLNCPQIFIDENINELGIGINLLVGWKLADIDGRVPVAYGSVYNAIGARAGSSNAVLIEHDHLIGDQSGSSGSGSLVGARYIGKEIESNSLGIPKTDLTGSTPGETGVNKNMQPYIVVLVIEKLP